MKRSTRLFAALPPEKTTIPLRGVGVAVPDVVGVWMPEEVSRESEGV